MTLSRHYYRCPECGHGLVPWDQVLGLDATRQTPPAREVIARTGAVDGFAESADKLLRKLSGLRVSESTIERVTEAVGARIGEARARGEVFGEATPWKWHRDADGKTVGYVSADATGVRIQGPGGAPADGRMINVGMIYSPIPDDPSRRAQPDHPRPPWQARYVTGMSGWDGLGEPLRRQAAQDEIVVECVAGQEGEASGWVRGAMVDGMSPLIGPVPTIVEITTGPTWGG
ncbi:MAG: hypothetical protein JWO38_4769 [Gemmataceae bacterium]|nr:hypothetical protein [Gemmataceae bacterium]